MTTKLFNAIKVSVLAIVLSLGLSYVYAWTAPTATPPSGNVSAPINTGTALQQKGGDLTVKNFIADQINVGLPINTNAITAPKFCIGASCITAWTQAGAVTNLVAGTNITLSPAGGTGAVTVSTAIFPPLTSNTACNAASIGKQALGVKSSYLQGTRDRPTSVTSRLYISTCALEPYEGYYYWS